jgi:DNA-directed RNA polymerase sigma subunit (sigma70/sigma32)
MIKTTVSYDDPSITIHEIGQVTDLPPAVLMSSDQEEEEALDLLRCYLDDINRVPLLTEAQERELATRLAEGDETARIPLIEANLRLVVHIAKHYQHLGLDLMDLIGAGNIGLTLAVKQFDASKGFSLSTSAACSIKETIQGALTTERRSAWLDQEAS